MAPFNDAFGKAVTEKKPFPAALKGVPDATVADMRKNNFKIAG